MDATTVFGFACTVLFGITFLGLLLHVLDPERQPVARKERTPALEGVRTARPSPVLTPAFFATPVASHGPSMVFGSDEGLFAFLQHHVRAEQAMVAEFVHLPSIDSLYRQARTPLTVN